MNPVELNMLGSSVSIEVLGKVFKKSSCLPQQQKKKSTKFRQIHTGMPTKLQRLGNANATYIF